MYTRDVPEIDFSIRDVRTLPFVKAWRPKNDTVAVADRLAEVLGAADADDVNVEIAVGSADDEVTPRTKSPIEVIPANCKILMGEVGAENATEVSFMTNDTFVDVEFSRTRAFLRSAAEDVDPSIWKLRISPLTRVEADKPPVGLDPSRRR